MMIEMTLWRKIDQIFGICVVAGANDISRLVHVDDETEMT